MTNTPVTFIGVYPPPPGGIESNANLTTTGRFSSHVVSQYRAMVCENTLENCRLFTNYSLVRVRIKFGCVKTVFRLCEARKDGLGWISCTVILPSSFALLMCVFSDIQWSNCFESIGEKQKFSFFFFFVSFHCLKQASETYRPRRGKILCLTEIVFRKEWLQARHKFIIQNLFDWERFRFFRHKFGFGAVNVRLSPQENKFF